MLIKVQGVRNGIVLLIASTVVTVAFPNGIIRQIGPLTLSPELRVLQVVPLMLSMFLVVTIHEFPSATIFLNSRVRRARVLSLSFSTTASLCLIAVGEAIAYQGTSFSALRNFLFLGGITLISAAVVGNVYAWILPIVGFSATLISPMSESDWSLYGLFFRDFASIEQIRWGFLVFIVGTIICVAHPRGFGYLRLRRPKA